MPWSEVHLLTVPSNRHFWRGKNQGLSSFPFLLILEAGSPYRTPITGHRLSERFGSCNCEIPPLLHNVIFSSVSRNIIEFDEPMETLTNFFS